MSVGACFKRSTGLLLISQSICATVRSPRGAELTTYPLRLTMEAPPRTGTPSPLIEALLLAGEDNGSWRVQAIKQLIGLPPSEDRKALLNYLASGGTIDTLESFRRCNG